MKHLLLLLSIFFLFTSDLLAKHIIGGSMTYKYISAGSTPNSNKYQFTLTVYRDCNGNGANFDFDAIVTIYEQIGSSYSLYSSDGKNITKEGSIPIEQIPCMNPPNVCVEYAEYTFTQDLPISGNSYHISYQRCCRNETITNLNTPGDIGATYTIELTNAAMLAKNNSPTFVGVPPIVICNKFPIAYDHSAVDEDGDLLIYSFCSPIKGGGNILSGAGATGCDGVTPDPGCPPPFMLATFIQPTYNPTKPMAGNPVVSINSNTGLLDGIPHQLGQYVVAVCVKEYRAGTLLSTIRREFQFNVADCQPDLSADVKKDTVLGFKNYLLNSCGNSDIEFINLSTGNGIENYYWEFDLNNGDVVTSTSKNATISFPDTGRYVGKMVLNKGSACSDSIEIAVNVFGEAIASFDYMYDTCEAGPVNFEDHSVSNAFITNWTWDFGDGTNDKVKNPSYLFGQPGIFPVSLRVVDGNNCEGDTTAIITWQPAPSHILIAPSTYNGCIPANIFFNNLSSPIDSTYTFEWDFGDGQTDSVLSPTHVFSDVGYYSIYLKITSPIGCEIENTFPDWIEVLPSPKANFSYTPEIVTSFNPIIDFRDESVDAVRWFWDFDNLATTQETNPSYAFQDTGIHIVSLRVVHESGCTDVVRKIIDVVPEITFFMPNAFTPNEDTTNDIFKGTGITDGIQNFQMIIWNRWGERIFHTSEVSTGWNGTKHNSGQASPPGVYVYEIQYTNPRGKDFHYRGFATLIR